jgi:hypothetical protein
VYSREGCKETGFEDGDVIEACERSMPGVIDDLESESGSAAQPETGRTTT